MSLFSDAWKAVVQGAVTAGAQAEEFVQRGSAVIKQEIDAGRLAVDAWQKQLINILSGHTPIAQAGTELVNIVQGNMQVLLNQLGMFAHWFPTLNHGGRSYSWENAKQSPQTLLWYAAGCYVADPARFMRIVGVVFSLDALDGYAPLYGADATGADEGPNSTPPNDVPDAGAGDGYSAPPPDAGALNRPPPPQSPDIMATVSAIITTIAKLAQGILSMFGPPNPNGVYTPAHGGHGAAPAGSGDSSMGPLLLVLLIALALAGEKKAA